MTAPARGHSPSSARRLERLNALRGPAALLVVLYHVRQIAVRDLGSAGPFELWRFGHAGVDLFFVISGFVIYFVHRSDIGLPSAAPHFLRRRVLRVYPPLWIVTTCVLVAAACVRGAVRAEKLDAWFIARSYALVPIEGRLPLLPPAWTLSHEMKFYLLFAAAIALPAIAWRQIAASVVLGSLAVATIQIAGGVVPFPVDFILSPYNLEFAAGVVAAIAVLGGRARVLPALAPAGLVLFAIAATHDAPAGSADGAQVARFGIGAFLMVAGVAARDLEKRDFRAPVLRLLGDASYAIYLVHLPVVIAGARAVRALGLGPGVVPLSALAVLATIVGIAFHLVVERPLTQALSQRFGRRRGVTATAR